MSSLLFLIREQQLADLAIGEWLWLPATRPERYRQAVFCGVTPRFKVTVRFWHEARDCRSDAHLGAPVSIWPQFPLRKCSYKPVPEPPEFKVSHDLEDAPDGARIFIDDLGAFYERQGDRWIRST